jgi:hypothetical protein
LPSKVAVDPALAVADLPGAVDHVADHHGLAGEPAREHVQQREVLVDVHHVDFARGLPHREERLEVAHRQRPARDRTHLERVAFRLGIRAERHHAHVVPALDQKAAEARHVHRGPAEVGREHGRGEKDAHGGRKG